MSIPRKTQTLNKVSVEELIRNTDSLTYLNALKVALSELKEEHANIEETCEYLNSAVERSRKIIRRIDNQYRAIIKTTARVYDPPEADLNLAALVAAEDMEANE